MVVVQGVDFHRVDNVLYIFGQNEKLLQKHGAGRSLSSIE